MYSTNHIHDFNQSLRKPSIKPLPPQIRHYSLIRTLSIVPYYIILELYSSCYLYCYPNYFQYEHFDSTLLPYIRAV